MKPLHLKYIVVNQDESLTVEAGWEIRKIELYGDKAHLLLEKEDARPWRRMSDNLKDD